MSGGVSGVWCCLCGVHACALFIDFFDGMAG